MFCVSRLLFLYTKSCLFYNNVAASVNDLGYVALQITDVVIRRAVIEILRNGAAYDL